MRVANPGSLVRGSENPDHQHRVISVLDSPGTVLIDSRNIHSGSGRTFVFANPERIITASAPEEVVAALEEMDCCLASGMSVAGYIAYEAGLVLDKPIQSRHRSDQPLVWLRVYRDCSEFDSESIDLGGASSTGARNLALNISEDEYLDSVRRIRRVHRRR